MNGSSYITIIGSKAIARAKATRISYGKASAKANRAQTVTLRIKPVAAAKRLLKQGRRLRVLIKLTFTPRGGGKRVTTSAHTTVRLAKKK